MDLSEYISKGQPRSNVSVVKKCRTCGRELDNQGTHLWYQQFCSERCKEKYVNGDE